ncbi:RHS repeat-associated core domain-containing protein, partial [Rhodanobacter sp. 115]|uniref:RHS repeat-associated core domain-containing protein n=1 Tax=Rhodanobacter sp. FW021-MT20 TaxID=1162282 RepID=UPI0009DB4325
MCHRPAGTPLAEADAQGHITARFDYSPYGSIALGTAPNGPGYTGHVNDPETGLVYMQQRYDDPSGGRFLSPDPVGVSPGNVYSFNRYAYADNNPINRTDPDGRDSVGGIIDENAQASANAGNHLATYGWAFAGAVWSALGAEPVSQVADKGTGAGTGNIVMAAVTIATLGKGEEAANVAKGVAEVTEDVAKDAGTLYHYTDAEGASAIKSSGVIKPDSSGRVFLTTDKIASKDANNALFMGQGGSNRLLRMSIS